MENRIVPSLTKCAGCEHLVIGKDRPECSAGFRCVYMHGTRRVIDACAKPYGYRTPEDGMEVETR